MRRGKSAGWLLTLLVAATIVSNAFLTPGIRHQHERGHAAHSHGGHHHHHHTTAAAGVDAKRPQALHAGTSQAHVHVTLFGFELTLPDFFGLDDAPVAALHGVTRPQSSRTQPDGPLLNHPHSQAELVQTLMQIRTLLPPQVRLSRPVPNAVLLYSCRGPAAGRDRPAPPVPPPRTGCFA